MTVYQTFCKLSLHSMHRFTTKTVYFPKFGGHFISAEFLLHYFRGFVTLENNGHPAIEKRFLH